MTDILDSLREANPGISLLDMDEAEFAEYGRTIPGLDVSGIARWLESSLAPGEGSDYRRSVGDLEDMLGPGGITWKQWADRFFGDTKAQIGWCCGKNRSLNAVEYHKSSEVIVAGTDAVLLLGRLRDISGFSEYDSSLARAFFLPAGTAVELYATTLHFAPMAALESGFRVAIVLPLGTNAPLERKPGQGPGEEVLLWATNKWLLACAGSRPAQRGARIGVSGNPEIVPVAG